MNRKLLKLAGLTAAVATAALSTVSVGVASAATVDPASCPTNKPLVVDSYFSAQNSGDYGVDGHVWALDAGVRFIRIWRVGVDTYCMQIRDVGTFTTFAGVSPEGTGTVRGGVTGLLTDTGYLRVYGKFAPTVRTKGYLGNFDAECQQDGSCAGSTLSIRASYFPSGYQRVDFGAFTATYYGGACGTWSQTNDGDTGDIVC